MRAVVIGAGISGLSVSLEFLGQGWDVTCYEAAWPGATCTHASMGIVYPTADIRNPQEVRAALSTSYQHYDSFLERYNIAAVRTSLVELAVSEAEMSIMTSSAELLMSEGLAIESVERGEVQRLFPGIRSFNGGYIYRNAYVVDAPGTLSRLREEVLGRGGSIRLDKAVAVANVGGKQVEFASGLRDGGDAVVVCAGAVSGLSECSKASVVMRGQAFVARGIDLHVPVYIQDLDLVPQGDGSILVGATQELGVNVCETTEGGVASLLSQFERFFGPMKVRQILEYRVGVRSCCPDMMPLVGKLSDVEDVYLLTGLWKNGIGLAPYLSHKLVQSIVGVATADRVLEPFRPDRFDARN